MRSLTKSMTLIIVAILLSAFTGCWDDSNNATGELGVLKYYLNTKYDAEGNLATGILPTKISHRIGAYSTGEEYLGRYEAIYHTVEPAENAILINHDNTYDVPDFTIKVTKPGKYVVTTKNSKKELDRITLNFEDPASLKVVTKVREPYGDSFDKKADSGVILVEEGSQVAFIPYLTTSSGTRMIGNVPCQFTADPDWMIVPDVEDTYITEDTSITFEY
ncbi:MAG TPA: hypothetical protein VLJ60_07485, partial [bacterium]|nr:hypothetical protein [bacterium]